MAFPQVCADVKYFAFKLTLCLFYILEFNILNHTALPYAAVLMVPVSRCWENPTPSARWPGAELVASSGDARSPSDARSPGDAPPISESMLLWAGGRGRCIPAAEVWLGAGGCVSCLRPCPGRSPQPCSPGNPSLCGFCHVKGFPNLYVGRK